MNSWTMVLLLLIAFNFVSNETYAANPFKKSSKALRRIFSRRGGPRSMSDVETLESTESIQKDSASFVTLPESMKSEDSFTESVFKALESKNINLQDLLVDSTCSDEA